MPHRRAWLAPLIEAAAKLAAVVLLLAVGIYYDHRQMPPGWITVAAISMLLGPEIRAAARALGRERIEQRGAQAPELLPEAEAALRLGPLLREHGHVVLLEVEEAIRRRALAGPPPGRRHVDGE